MYFDVMSYLDIEGRQAYQLISPGQDDCKFIDKNDCNFVNESCPIQIILASIICHGPWDVIDEKSSIILVLARREHVTNNWSINDDPVFCIMQY